MIKNNRFEEGRLINRRRIWNKKKILKRIYEKWWKDIKRSMVPGRILELGGGGGNLKEFCSRIITTDIIQVLWLDAVFDAHRIPFKDETIGNILMLDVFHHLSSPIEFLYEARRVLKPGGRVLMVEPYVSKISYFLYRYLHPEGLNMNYDPFDKNPIHQKAPLEGNQAIPTILFERKRELFKKSIRFFKIIKNEKMDFLIYPLSGGYRNICLCPYFLYDFFNKIESYLMNISEFIAFRMFVVLEKV